MRSRLPLLAALTAFGAAALVTRLPDAAAELNAIKPPEPIVLAADDKEKERITAEMQATSDGKDGEKALVALASMLERTSPDFVPFIRKSIGSSDPKVAGAAIRAAASHELKDEEKRVRKFLTSKPKGKDEKAAGVVVASSIDYLARLGFAGEQETILKEHLRLFFTDEQKVKQPWAPMMFAASCHYLGKFKHKRAVPFIVEEMLKEPVPENVAIGSNPPEAYWKARYGIWQDGGEGWARWALKEITGQEFRTAREWQAWVKVNKKDLEK